MTSAVLPGSVDQRSAQQRRHCQYAAQLRRWRSSAGAAAALKSAAMKLRRRRSHVGGGAIMADFILGTMKGVVAIGPAIKGFDFGAASAELNPWPFGKMPEPLSSTWRSDGPNIGFTCGVWTAALVAATAVGTMENELVSRIGRSGLRAVTASSR